MMITKLKRMLNVALVLLMVTTVFILAKPASADPGIITVPDDYSTIQGAVNAANPGDTVYVKSGTYYEHVSISKSITLQGENRETTIIDGSGSGDVIYIIASNVTISGLTVTNGEYGIWLINNYTINHVTIKDTIITSNIKDGINAGHNYSPSNDLIENCIISNNGAWGLYAHQFSSSIIRDCEVFGNLNGLDPAWGSNTLVANNQVHDNINTGIWLDSMTTSIVEGNKVYSNDTGIYLGYYAQNNTVRENTVFYNNLGIGMGGPSVLNNRMYHNDLIGNNTQASDGDGDNIWDNGYPSGGNYWSDYSGEDSFNGPNQDLSGSDGIGDTPYQTSGLGEDKYPLMSRQFNETPSITLMNAPVDPVQINAQVSVDASFSDPDIYDSHTAMWEWGDENTSEGTVTEADGSGSVTGSHIYDTSGIYTVTLTVADGGGDSDQSIFEYVVAYDPGAGFVTGGGWIDSPEGAYSEDPTLTGKATFGFVSKYKKGADIPEGNTEFQFKAGDLKFTSTSYDWLVVTGSDYARYKGSGDINGSGGYKFMLWAGDGTGSNGEDTFRIKIWEEENSSETVVYDNGMDQEIGGGNIVVHTK